MTFLWVRGAAILLLATACNPEPAQCPVSSPIIDVGRFRLVPASEDRFEAQLDGGIADAGGSDAGGIIARARCTEADLESEDLGGIPSFSIKTAECSRATIATLVLAPVHAGESLRFSLWHYSLTRFETAEAQAILAFDHGVAWRQSIPIPSEGGLLSAAFPAPSALPIGALVELHIENHGANSWNAVALEVVRPGTCPDG